MQTHTLEYDSDQKWGTTSLQLKRIQQKKWGAQTET